MCESTYVPPDCPECNSTVMATILNRLVHQQQHCSAQTQFQPSAPPIQPFIQ